MTDDDRLDRWLEDWEDRRDRGDPVGPDEYLAVVGGGGALAGEFRRRAAALLAVAGRLLPPPAADGDAPQTGLGAGAAAGDDTPGGGAAGTDPAGLPAGTMLGQFRVVGRLGRGGMGVVYEAEDTLLGRRVAVKTLPAGGGADDPEVARLLREARAAARLNHPHVLAVYHVGEWAGGWFLVLELAPGGSLQDRLAGGRGVPWRVATRLAADACRGVQAAHAAGLVHRDLKPGNLLVGADGRVRVADFGLVRGAGLSSSGSGAGTPAYMSPEQCRGEAGDARSDVYALGATYYALLTGRPPYPAENAVGAIYAHCHAPVPDPRAAAADVPAAAARVVGRAMAKDPAARYPTAGDLLEALAAVDALADAEPFEFTSESLPAEGPQRRTAPRAGRALLVLAILSGLVTAGVKLAPNIGRNNDATSGIGEVMGQRSDVEVRSLLGNSNATPTAVTTGSGPGVDGPAPAAKVPSAKSATRTEPGQAVYVSKSTGMRFVRVEPGTFTMGAPVGEPGRAPDENQHSESIAKPYWVGVYEVTRGEFRQFVSRAKARTEAETDGLGSDGWDFGRRAWQRDSKYTWLNPGFPQTDDHPVTEVSWNDAQRFCAWMSEADGKKYRLPTEAEWEYACRASGAGRFCFGDDEGELHHYGNVADAALMRVAQVEHSSKADDGFAFTAPVGRYRPSRWGIHDMHGNVWEWCQDLYHPGYRPPAQSSGSNGPRVLRGGDWINGVEYARSAKRDKHPSNWRNAIIGFRVVMEQPEAEVGSPRECPIADGIGMRFCWVPAGAAELGSPATEAGRGPLEFRRTFRTDGFWLGKYEVTQGEWQAVMGTNPSYHRRFTAAPVTDADTSRYPVEQVSREDCQRFVERLNARPAAAAAFPKPGRFVVPTEDEWEYACRGGLGADRPFYFGDRLGGNQANFDDRKSRDAAPAAFLGRTTPVGRYEQAAPHPWGLCDMHGNVWEFCDSVRPAGLRVIRGGCFGSPVAECRSASRNFPTPDIVRYINLGFRVCFRPD